MRFRCEQLPIGITIKPKRCLLSHLAPFGVQGVLSACTELIPTLVKRHQRQNHELLSNLVFGWSSRGGLILC